MPPFVHSFRCLIPTGIHRLKRIVTHRLYIAKHICMHTYKYMHIYVSCAPGIEIRFKIICLSLTQWQLVSDITRKYIITKSGHSEVCVAFPWNQIEFPNLCHNCLLSHTRWPIRELYVGNE